MNDSDMSRYKIYLCYRMADKGLQGSDLENAHLHDKDLCFSVSNVFFFSQFIGLKCSNRLIRSEGNLAISGVCACVCLCVCL